MTTTHIQSLFANDVTREIEEVIKVDQTDEQIIKFEIDEYVVTDEIAKHYQRILERYDKAPNHPTDGIGIWVSGFFGSGKSSFAKLLGLAIDNREIAGVPASERFAARATPAVKVLLNQITERTPTHAVIFDVSTDRGIRSGNQTLTEIMYRLFLDSLGYAKDLDLSELEIQLEAEGRLDEFRLAFERVTGGRSWDDRKGMVAFALSEASAAMHDLEPAIYAEPGAWARDAKGKADITPGLLAQRVKALTELRKPGHSVLFVIDEVGQFIAHDVQKMLDLQAVVQQFGVHGRGKHWVAVTSQERLNELVGGLGDKRIELARLMDRFPQPSQVHLEPSDISEVTSKRVLSKNADAQAQLGDLFKEHRGQLTAHTRLTADILLPELSRSGFIDLYPLLPYQIDLIIQVVSGLRTQGGANKHVGGANRTIIKLAQQLLIHPDVALGERPVGDLATLDVIYDLVESNISSEIRGKIKQIPSQVTHPRAQAVAKAVCLLQFVQSVHRTADNIAACLYPRLGAPSELESVAAALRELEAAHLVRHADDGYRIPSPAEDDWDKTRDQLSPKPSDIKRLHSEIISGFWKPQPSYTLSDVKSFKAGLVIDGREIDGGDLTFHLGFAEEGEDFTELAAELRTRSQLERDAVFWVVPLDKAIDRESVELFRSREMESRKGRDARTADETALIGEERARSRRHHSELQRLLRKACLTGSAYFAGNDRSPDGKATDVAKAAAAILGQVLPDVFTRFDEGAAKPGDVKRGLDALLTATDLQGLPSVFASLGLLRDEGDKTVFDVDAAALRDVLAEIESGAKYGQKASGKSLAEHFGRPPYGWDFDLVRLLTAVLLRSGKVQMTHKAEPIETATSVYAKDAFNNNNYFKAATFQPKEGVDFGAIARAAENYKLTFGTEAKELALSPLATEIRAALGQHQDAVQGAKDLLVHGRLPGVAVLDTALDEIRAIQRTPEAAVIADFNSSHQTIKEAIRRANELSTALTPGALEQLRLAATVMHTQWPVLAAEPDLSDETRSSAGALEDLLARETFFRELADIERHRAVIASDHDARFDAALKRKVAVYQAALDELVATAGWNDQNDEVKATISQPLRVHAQDDGAAKPPLSQLRADVDACLARLDSAVSDVHAIVEGERMVKVDPRAFFRDGVEDVEQLDAALSGLRDECERLIADGKKIVVR
jgi:thioredoxin-like negative regulator of GroEL